MTRVIHTGDTHLGYRQYHSPRRREDFLAAFRQVIEDAIAEEVDAVVHAGDLFHDRSPSLADVHGAIQVLRDLRNADVPFLAVVGNHERTREGQWLDLFQTLGLATRLGDEPTRVGDVAFYGLDFVAPSRRGSLEYDFAPHDAEFAALVAHGPFEPFVPEVRNDRWDLPALLEAASVEFDAALLGDDHTPETARIDGTWATYCGSTERVDATEREDRGYNLVEFDEGVRISRRGLETRPFVLLDVELASGEGVERVRERIREEDVEDAVVVVRIDGEGEEVHPASVEEFAIERGALVARVSDRREVETAESVPEVSFADPDRAVRERIDGMGLSAAGATIDATVRDDGIADANVRGRVGERVETLLAEDPDALEPPETDSAGASEPAADEEAERPDASPGEAVPATEDGSGAGSGPGAPEPRAVTAASPGSGDAGDTEADAAGDEAGDAGGSKDDDRVTTIEDFL